jgi:hypothetical protein
LLLFLAVATLASSLPRVAPHALIRWRAMRGD